MNTTHPNATPFVETNCTIEHEGHTYTSGGSVITSNHVIGYLTDDDPTTDMLIDCNIGFTPTATRLLNRRLQVLKTWHSEYLGVYWITATWPTPGSYVSSHQYQVYAVVNSVLYLALIHI